ncbi:uncharacterized protein LACBIDRAFT_329457 [Laccaria bicolor S238N-H82]|uniref:Predicted protein n=1 Tax=Laccaria bicolor (strain S238N-H82 / ATCC MYA-4686) TaxID=486041 RepID=B0DI32_LACBS|nr:uncharacterized protein LACBIDRAFT_329457 [Laccaria bicolor S238N-H82]EDR05838.1 predicted protein [Laccaria bicolor S238N-H82]|eukprot:XP_001883514.1 predicted protein [Laccaria bicolor S238N-H82]
MYSNSISSSTNCLPVPGEGAANIPAAFVSAINCNSKPIIQSKIDRRSSARRFMDATSRPHSSNYGEWEQPVKTEVKNEQDYKQGEHDNSFQLSTIFWNNKEAQDLPFQAEPFTTMAGLISRLLDSATVNNALFS